MAKDPISSKAARREGIVKDRPGYQGKGGASSRPKPPKRPKRGR